MSSVSGFSGVYAVDWMQTASGDEWGMDPDLLSVGMAWRWSGTARRLDAGAPLLRLDQPSDRAAPRARARARLRRLALADNPAEDPVELAPPFGPGAGAAMTLTDGVREYHARILRGPGRTLAVFDPLLPLPGRGLWITGVQRGAAPATCPGVICFLPGSAIATPAGPVAVEDLRPGDLVQTRDNGAQPVLWRGETRLSGAELYLHPGLRPLRIRAGALGGDRPGADLLVSPGHRVLVPAPAAVSDEGEVLVSAAALEDGRGVRRDFTLGSVRYVHLMLPRHEILTANGLPCESFHPGLADARVLRWHARSLEQAVPGITGDPWRIGAPARHCPDAGEAAILRAEAW